jgi:hypothetical protein
MSLLVCEKFHSLVNPANKQEETGSSVWSGKAAYDPDILPVFNISMAFHNHPVAFMEAICDFHHPSFYDAKFYQLFTDYSFVFQIDELFSLAGYD